MAHLSRRGALQFDPLFLLARYAPLCRAIVDAVGNISRETVIVDKFKLTGDLGGSLAGPLYEAGLCTVTG